MKRMKAFIPPHRLNSIVSALHALPCFPGFTVFDAHEQGQGRRVVVISEIVQLLRIRDTEGTP